MENKKSILISDKTSSLAQRTYINTSLPKYIPDLENCPTFSLSVKSLDCSSATEQTADKSFYFGARENIFSEISRNTLKKKLNPGNPKSNIFLTVQTSKAISGGFSCEKTEAEPICSAKLFTMSLDDLWCI